MSVDSLIIMFQYSIQYLLVKFRNFKTTSVFIKNNFLSVTYISFERMTDFKNSHNLS